jgi:hypothetical protein
MSDEPSSEAVSAARDLAFHALMDEVEVSGSYLRSIGEAAYRGDELTVGVHLRQLRLRLIAMLSIYNAGIVANGPHASRALDESHRRWQERNRQDQRPGDGMA